MAKERGRLHGLVDDDVIAAEKGKVSVKQINLGEFKPIRTSPEISSSATIKLTVRNGSTNISFRIFPVKEEILRWHREIKF